MSAAVTCGSAASTTVSGSSRLNVQGWNEAFLARPDVVQRPEDVYIWHTRTCNPLKGVSTAS